MSCEFSTKRMHKSNWIHVDTPVTIEDRFVLHFKKSATAALANNDDLAKVWLTQTDLNIQSLVKDLEVKAVALTDAGGKQIAIGNLQGGNDSWKSILPAMAQGAYIVSLETNVGQKSYKLLYTGN